MTGAHPPRRIGILGGMGPEATVLLMTRIIQRTPAEDDADHIPMIVDNNTQVPSRIKALIEHTGEDPGPTLARMARDLQSAGAEALAMPCNTAHNYAPVIAAAVSIPLLDMVALSTGHVSGLLGRGGRVGLLASPAVRLTGIFDRAFAAAGLDVIHPASDQPLLTAIRAIKRSSSDPQARDLLVEAAEDLSRAGAELLLVACSELSIISAAIAGRGPVVDTIDVLADAVVQFAGRR